MGSGTGGGEFLHGKGGGKAFLYGEGRGGPQTGPGSGHIGTDPSLVER